MLITEDQNLSFWEDVHKGALSVANAQSAAVEWRRANMSQTESVAELIEISGLCGLDGILTCSSDDPNMKAAIDEASERGVPIFMLGSDISDSLRKGYIGTDNYAAGKTVGSLLSEDNLDCKNAVLIGTDIAKENAGSDEFFIAGLKSAIYNMPHINLEYLDTGSTPFAVEALIREGSQGRREIDAVVCRSIEDTIICANAVIENNLVGRIKIIGCNEDRTVLEYLEKGIVQAAITSDGETIGKAAMESFLFLRENGWANEFVPVETDVITPENLPAYLAKYN
jgi:ribose transport system substrate-binding protein